MKKAYALLISILVLLFLTACNKASLVGSYSGLSNEGIPIAIDFNTDGTATSNLFGFDLPGKYTISRNNIEITTSVLGVVQTVYGQYSAGDDKIVFTDVILEKGELSVDDLQLSTSPSTEDNAAEYMGEHLETLEEEDFATLYEHMSRFEDESFDFEMFQIYIQGESEVVKEHLYEMGIHYYDRGRYENALKCFTALDDFSNAQEFVNLCGINSELLENYKYTMSDNGISISEYLAYEKTVVIPHGTYELKSGNSTVRGTFRNNARLEEVVFPKTLIKIGDYSFFGCTNLTNVHIPPNIQEIGSYAFMNSGLVDALLPNTLEINNVGGGIFKGCKNLKKAVIEVRTNHAGINFLKNDFFEGCTSLTEVSLPDEVTDMGGSFFRECSSLQTVRLPNGLERLYSYAFTDCISLETIVLPASLEEIDIGTFGGCTNLNSIVIPEGVTMISVGAFKNCSSLSSVALPSSLTTIKPEAFFGCTSLHSIRIPKKTQEISWDAFIMYIASNSANTKALPIVFSIYEDSGAHRILDGWNESAYNGIFEYVFVEQ